MRRTSSTKLLIVIWFMILDGDTLETTLNVDPGEDIRLNCSTEASHSVDWQYRQRKDSKEVSIYIGNYKGGGSISNDYISRTRYQVLVDESSGKYDLTIADITESDEGLYTCTDVVNPDISQTTAIVVSGEKSELCSNDVPAVLHGGAELSFPTTRTDDIQLEHRAIDQQYLQHVFRDGKIMNDYYVLSERFSFNVSSDSWNLMIRDIQRTDAGTYVCSENNGLGTQYKKELVVVDSVAHVEVSEMCSPEVLEANITCSANYTGNCPPRLELRVGRTIEGEGEQLILSNGAVTVDGRAVSVTTRLTTKESQHEWDISCVLAAPSSDVILYHTNRAVEFTAQITGCRPNKDTSSEVNLKYLGLLVFLVFIPMSFIITWAVYERAKKRKPEIRLSTSKEEEPLQTEM